MHGRMHVLWLLYWCPLRYALEANLHHWVQSPLEPGYRACRCFSIGKVQVMYDNRRSLKRRSFRLSLSLVCCATLLALPTPVSAESPKVYAAVALLWAASGVLALAAKRKQWAASGVFALAAKRKQCGGDTYSQQIISRRTGWNSAQTRQVNDGNAWWYRVDDAMACKRPVGFAGR